MSSHALRLACIGASGLRGSGYREKERAQGPEGLGNDAEKWPEWVPGDSLGPRRESANPGWVVGR